MRKPSESQAYNVRSTKYVVGGGSGTCGVALVVGGGDGGGAGSGGSVGSNGSVDEISVGVSTANSQYPSASGNGQVLNAGHLYIEFWSNHAPQLSQPIQAGSIQRAGVGWLGSANFFQSVQTQPQAFLGLSPDQASSLAATIQYKKSVYDDNFAAEITPLYYADRMNSNTWAAGILLASGISQGTVDQIVSKLNAATGGTEYPYGYGNGNQLLQYF